MKEGACGLGLLPAEALLPVHTIFLHLIPGPVALLLSSPATFPGF